MKGFIEECLRKCLAGERLSRNEIIRLLDVEPGGVDDRFLREAAREASQKIAGGKGYIWCAVGMDYAPCSMNCKFCSFGEKWGIVREPRHFEPEQVFAHVRTYAENGAAYIVLRTTEFYDLDRLLGFIPEIRAKIPGGYAIVLNTGELDAAAAAKAKAAGVYGVYHALRLREGTDTPFNPAERIATMKNVSASGMTLVSLVEPLGCEHTDEEIADSFLNAAACGAKICGAMARFPVEGTPFGSSPMISGPHLAHVVAALRLSGGSAVRDICVHKATHEALESGANVMVVESGAIPRDSDFSEKDWAGVDMARAREMLAAAGYEISLPPAL
ncbi:radical SAM protein [uncultured Cloacibacillus sp.]|uniref:radical SAM protein n=1 Tax=uncultured Cloacibacillus sp. TaxID=889794 RepID=UPI0026DB1F1F|nr:radical SAM protein [uncultured Cloacibacillus sp.]